MPVLRQKFLNLFSALCFNALSKFSVEQYLCATPTLVVLCTSERGYFSELERFNFRKREDELLCAKSKQLKHWKGCMPPVNATVVHVLEYIVPMYSISFPFSTTFTFSCGCE